MSFYNLIKNNKDAFDSEELNNYQLKTDIIKHPRIKETNLSDVSVDNFMLKSKDNDDVIYGTKVIMFNMIEKIYPLEKFEFCYIPFIYKNKDVNKKYYLLVKDMETFFSQPIMKLLKVSTLSIDNYYNVFVIVETTQYHPNIEDIIVKNYLIHKEIQCDEAMKIVSNMMNNIQMFVIDMNINGLGNILKTDVFENYRKRTVTLLKQIIESDKLKYGIDYELPHLDTYPLLGIPYDDIITREYILENSRYSISKYVNNCMLDNKPNTIFYFVNENVPDVYGLNFSYDLPGKEWTNFYEGVEVYEKPARHSLCKPTQNVDNHCEKYPELKKYLDSIPDYKNKYTKTLKPVEKIYNPQPKDFSIISSTNNTLLNKRKSDF